jgi:hypothetical protein
MGAHLVKQITLLVLSADFTAGKAFALQAGTTNGLKH